eukprot:gene11497-34214_t
MAGEERFRNLITPKAFTTCYRPFQTSSERLLLPMESDGDEGEQGGGYDTVQHIRDQQLQDVLETVEDEERVCLELKHQHREEAKKNEELTARLAKLSMEHRTAVLQLEQAVGRVHDLKDALGGEQAKSRELGEVAKSCRDSMEAEVRRKEEDKRRTQLDMESLKLQLEASLKSQQTLSLKAELEASLKSQQAIGAQPLGQRDALSHLIGHCCNLHSRDVYRLQGEVSRLEGVLRATGERAAMAEAQLHDRSETITRLHAELSSLRERYHGELSELKAERVAASESRRLREQLDAAQSVAAAMAAARDELRLSMNTVTSRLAETEERCKRLLEAASVRDSVLLAMAEALDTKVAEAAAAAGKAVACEVSVAQQESHIKLWRLMAPSTPRQSAAAEAPTLQRQ